MSNSRVAASQSLAWPGTRVAVWPYPGDDPPSVRAIRQALEGEIEVAVVGQAGQLNAGGRIPDDQVRAVAGGDPAAVRAEGHAPKASGDLAAGEDLPAGH